LRPRQSKKIGFVALEQQSSEKPNEHRTHDPSLGQRKTQFALTAEFTSAANRTPVLETTGI